MGCDPKNGITTIPRDDGDYGDPVGLRANVVSVPNVSTSNFVSSEIIPSTPRPAARSICLRSFTVHVTTNFPASWSQPTSPPDTTRHSATPTDPPTPSQ